MIFESSVDSMNYFTVIKQGIRFVSDSRQLSALHACHVTISLIWPFALSLARMTIGMETVSPYTCTDSPAETIVVASGHDGSSEMLSSSARNLSGIAYLFPGVLELTCHAEVIES
jgi:hypothetical protein